MNIPPGSRLNFFATGPNGRFEIIPGPPTLKTSAPTKPINAPPRPDPDQMRMEAYERMCLEESLNPAKIFAARAATQSENTPAKPSNFSLNADEIYAQRRINHAV